MRTIRVTGRGQIFVKPDTTRITVTLSGLHKDYGETLRRSSEDTEALRDVAAGFGFAPSDLKTLRFGVDTEYEGYTDKNGAYKQRFAGYRFRHEMKLEFPSDNDRLGKLLYALANSGVDPELRLSYTVKDPEAAKNALLAKAVTDAREKAAVLTRAAGVTLKDMQSIDYSWGEISLEYQTMSSIRMKSAAADAVNECYSLSMEPDDIDVADTVTVVWEID